MMARMKMVNGEMVPMTGAEEAERDAEDAAFNSLPDIEKRPPPALTAEDIFDMFEAKGQLTMEDRPLGKKERPARR